MLPHVSPHIRQSLNRIGRGLMVAHAVSLFVLAVVLGLSSMADRAAAQEVRTITWPIDPAYIDIVDPWTDTYGAPRGGGRTHLGVDICGPKMTPLVAANDGTVTWMRHASSGNNLVITDDDGWKYHYIHINNDSPGTDDGANNFDEAFAPGIEQGARVEAGQHVAFLGDSGNAEGTCPHLHFEIERPDGQPINPTPSVDLAAARIGEEPLDPSLGLSYPSMSTFVVDVITTLTGRPPSQTDIAAFTATVTQEGVAAALEPLVGPDSLAATIDRLYFATFLRLPDAEGYEYWISQEAGDSSLAEISQFFATSDEFEARFGGKDYEALLVQIYRDMFGRSPDEEGMQYWLDRLADPDDPVTPGTVLSYFSDGIEAKEVAGTRSELVALTSLFEDRMPTDAEIEAWQQLRQTTSFANAVSQRFLSG